MGERMKFSTRMNSISLFIVLFGLAACAAGDEVARKPKLFYVSTSATTSTLNTASVCYVTSGTPTACTGRRRRAVNIEGVPLADGQPSQLSQEVQSSENELKNNREGRFLLYWITTTSISTSTSYTVTVSISAATCTPAVTIHWSVCGKK